jgi:3-oxoacyl-[acyl-carrier-protein] synthase-3
MYARIIGTGSYLPERVVHQRRPREDMDTSDAWIRERTGIERRHIAAEGQTTVDLASRPRAARSPPPALNPDDIDLIVFGTTTPDLVFPNCGAMLQARLGIRTGCPAMGVEAACSSFIYALSVADKFVKLGEAKRALVVGAETLTRGSPTGTDRTTAVLFADGAGAVVLAASEEPGIISTHLHADGSYKDLLYCPVGVSKPASSRRTATVPMHITHGRQRGLQGRGDASLGSIVDETLARQRPRQVGTSTGWCRTRPTSASSRPWPRSSTCRWSG